MEQFKIQSNAKGIDSLEQYIYVLCDELHILNYFATISIPVLQAAQNAITHGNKNDENKHVDVEYGDFRGGVYFEIRDEGEGFDYSQYGGLVAENQSGNGIFLMKMLSDNMEYSDNGRCLRLEFLIQGVESSFAMERKAALRNFFQTDEVVV